MSLHEISAQLVETSRYSSSFDGDLLTVVDLESEAAFILESFGECLQIRQTVALDAASTFAHNAGHIYVLCSMLNSRFSGCKMYLDAWDAVVTGFDVLPECATVDFLEVAFSQVHFMSLGMHRLLNILRFEERLPFEEEIDTALDTPTVN
jgi:hypothetical protein